MKSCDFKDENGAKTCFAPFPHPNGWTEFWLCTVHEGVAMAIDLDEIAKNAALGEDTEMVLRAESLAKYARALGQVGMSLLVVQEMGMMPGYFLTKAVRS